MNVEYPAFTSLALAYFAYDQMTVCGWVFLLKIWKCGWEYKSPNKTKLQKPVYHSFQKIIKAIKLEWTLQELKPSLNWCIFISIAFDYSCYVITMLITVAICQYGAITSQKYYGMKSRMPNDGLLWAPILEEIGQAEFHLGSWKQCVGQSLNTYNWGETS